MTNVEFPHPKWFGTERFDGYGSIDVVRHDGRDCLALRPATPASLVETHAALATSALVHGDFEATFADVTTIAQLRGHGPANPWERAWVLWHYLDQRHFYYVILKVNGWELGKADPAYRGGQRFLTTGERPCFPVGRSNTVRIRQRDNVIDVDVDHERITTFIDNGDPAVAGSARAYRRGRFGLYCEDASVRFGGFSLRDGRA